MQSTSIDSYQQCYEDGLLCRRQFAVLRFFLNIGIPLTRGDVGRHFKDTNTGYQRRVQELEQAGLLKCIGTVEDTHTGRKVKAYKPTGAIPDTKITSRKPTTTVTIRVWEVTGGGSTHGIYFSEEEAVNFNNMFLGGRGLITDGTREAIKA